MRFLTSSETKSFIRRDPDSYLRNLSNCDLHARHHPDYFSYMSQTKGLNFSHREKTQIKKLALKTDLILRSFPDSSFFKTMSEIDWIFAKTSSNYEDGMPHTRENVIFIPASVANTICNPKNRQFGIRVLLHEKTHIFQRRFPEITRKFVYCKYHMVPFRVADSPLKRSNPDIDEFDYIDQNTGLITSDLYNSDTPKKIYEDQDNPKKHPYEIMAYEMESLGILLSSV